MHNTLYVIVPEEDKEMYMEFGALYDEDLVSMAPYGVDYFKAFSKNEEHEAINWFLNLMKERNAAVDKKKKTFSLSAENKQKLFSTRYDQLQSVVRSMTLEDFADDDKVWNLRNIIEDRNDDLVLNQYAEIATFDSFCRTLVPDTKYVVLKAYDIHR